jgi:hypothetical protein
MDAVACRKKLDGRDTVSAEFSGSGKRAADYKFTIEEPQNRSGYAGHRESAA